MRFLAVCTAACLGAAAVPPVPIAIQDVSVVDVATGTTRAHQTLILEGERIRSAGPSASTAAPKGAVVVDGKGKFLIPGLWDMHVHLWYPQNQLPVFVAFGVT